MRHVLRELKPVSTWVLLTIIRMSRPGESPSPTRNPIVEGKYSIWHQSVWLIVPRASTRQAMHTHDGARDQERRCHADDENTTMNGGQWRPEEGSKKEWPAAEKDHARGRSDREPMFPRRAGVRQGHPRRLALREPTPTRRRRDRVARCASASSKKATRSG